MAYDEPRALFVLIIVLFYFLSPDPFGASQTRRRDFDDQIAKERFDLQVLNNSNYASFDPSHDGWLNLTGLRKHDGFAWDLLPKVQSRAKEQRQAVIPDLSMSWLNQSETEIALTAEAHSSRQEISDTLYRNITGFLRGEWIRSEVEEIHYTRAINLTALVPNAAYNTQKLSRNITGPSGDLNVKLSEQSSEHSAGVDPNIVQKIKAEVEIQDETSGSNGWITTMYGFHLVQKGSIVLSTTSEKFAGVFALPHFALSAGAFEPARQMLIAGLNKTIDTQEASASVFNPWSSAPDASTDVPSLTPHCECLVYLQQHPSDARGTSLQAIEAELRNPTGANLPSAPLIHMSALIFSPDCGFILESKSHAKYPAEGMHLVGKKLESYTQQARMVIQLLAVIVFSQVLVLKKQMNETSTPSMSSRISLNTAFVLVLGDGFAFGSFVFASLFVEGLFLPLIVTAFLAFLGVSFFGMRFLMDIWKAQMPERQERERERQRLREQRNAVIPLAQSLDPASNPSTFASNSDTLPLPVTARRPPDRPSTPIIITPDQDLDAAEAEDAALVATTTTTATGSARREMGALYTRFYCLLVILLLLSLHATSWPKLLRSLYCNLLVLAYLSVWVPQIYRNVMRNCRKALSWHFVIGQSLLRLAPFAYFYTQEDNILHVQPDSHEFLVLLAWIWLQIFILGTQEVVGPRFFVPDGWAPTAYDYHPILREGDSETGGNMPVGFSEAIASPTSPMATPFPNINNQGTGQSRTKSGDQRTFDCAICTETLDVPVIPAEDREGSKASSTGATTIFARRAYMVTPCRHIFHSACLEGWTRYRLQCPICREGLPSL
ncbi:uncharacterized protein KY384_004957 [Bacidia gigantensis]|uniref:uncharacterized protein n=1 Tax=Bacidia gigantensis TaxID=2732470 RepID=UPI001D04E9EB|nr:uncharacterized protein KY384_004957 [Bacidia gigantensis]KAG8530455.1 hypothetical protein KY384_004957 [Bacidia gigantensis]